MTNKQNTLIWQGCYDEGWKGLIVDEAFAHPAKFAFGLVRRIVAFGLERGYWRKGDVIGDPFGGVALGGIVCGYAGLNWIGCELEPRFVELGNRNLAMHGPKLMALGEASCVKLVQGDSRRFAEIVGPIAGAVTSPPYAETIDGTADRIDWEKADPKWRTGKRRSPGRGAIADGYGSSPGQIGSLPAGSVDGVLTSPPFRDARSDTAKSQPTRHGGPAAERHHTTQAGAGYGGSEGQIDNLPTGSVDAVVTSPPYAECVKGDHAEQETAKESRAKRKTPGGSTGQSQRHGGYGVSEGQIGALKEGELDGAITSPPFDAQMNQGGASKTNIYRKWCEQNGRDPDRPNAQTQNSSKQWGDTEGQIGNDKGETYWQAMSQVYASMRDALKPGGVCAIVVKDYVKDGKRVSLCDQTCRLLEHLGLSVFLRCRAMLVKEETHAGLFGKVTKRTERKSFFRRLAEKKGSPRIDWEECLFARKS